MAEPSAPVPPDVPDRRALFERLGRLRAHRIRFIQQLSSADCGAACLAMVLAYHGRTVRLQELRDLIAADREGTDALAMLNAAH